MDISFVVCASALLMHSAYTLKCIPNGRPKPEMKPFPFNLVLSCIFVFPFYERDATYKSLIKNFLLKNVNKSDFPTIPSGTKQH